MAQLSLRTLVTLAVLVGICSTTVGAAPILFDFESPPAADSGDGINPTFTNSGLTITFSSTTPPAAQWVNDGRSEPFAGAGSMRLTQLATGGGPSSARMAFSTPVLSVSLQAFHLVNAPVGVFTIEALSSTNALLASTTIAAGSPYTLVSFSGIGPIASLDFDGAVNFSYWDNLAANPIPEPATIGLLGIGLAGTFFVRRRRRAAKSS